MGLLGRPIPAQDSVTAAPALGSMSSSAGALVISQLLLLPAHLAVRAMLLAFGI